MGKRVPEPIVRCSCASDPNPEKVAAALQFWRQALARKLNQHQPAALERESDGQTNL